MKTTKLKYPAVCRCCGYILKPGDRAHFQKRWVYGVKCHTRGAPQKPSKTPFTQEVHTP